jgi:DNA (cytosine-5)-methyltransferase 1
MKFGSVCSGIEAASVAWHPLGWTAAWLSEIEPFPCAVLKHHYPDVPNHGDMTLLPEKILSGQVEAPDLFCGGTPCQAFSVAGLRNSLDDARGNLSLTFVGIANAIDHVRSLRGDSPAIVFWENVPGVLNTKDNAFGCFLGALAGESEPIKPPGGGESRWSNAGCVFGPQRTVAWRVLDAQYFGVAQRRRRVFVVASSRDDINPAEILFEFEGVRRDTPQSREQGQEIAGTVTARFGNSRNNQEELAPVFGVSPDGKDTVGTLMARDYKGIGNQDLKDGRGLVLEPIAFPSTLSGTQCASAENIAPSMGAKNPMAVATPMSVRRLTAIECERLQGFPDNYSNIPWRGKAESPDGIRYKALGNSWAVPVVAWIGQRIQDQIK